MNRRRPNHIDRALPATVAMLATACMTVLSASPASAVERIAVTEIKPLLMRAAERGEAHGVLAGTGAAYLQRRFDTASPIEVDVRRLRTLSQSGCGRLEVTTRQRAVLVNGNRSDQDLAYELNFCADGRFPGER
jgi:hypothetical protein